MKKKGVRTAIRQVLLLLLVLMLALSATSIVVSAKDETAATIVYKDNRPFHGWHSGQAWLQVPNDSYTISGSATGNFDQKTHVVKETCNGPYAYYLRDSQGNIVQKFADLKLDNTRPEAPATIEEAFTYTVTDTTITVTVFEENWRDVDSGISYYNVTVKQGDHTELSSPMLSNPYTFTGFNPNVPYTVTVTATDQVGNAASVSTADDAVVTDRSDLSGATIYINDQAAYTATYTAQSITFDPAVVRVVLPSGREVPADQYDISYENNVAIGTDARLTVTAKADGDYLNSASVTFSIVYLETTARAELAFGSTGSDGWKGGFASFKAPEGYTVSFNGADAGSFISFVEYTANVDGEIVYYLKNAAGEIARITLPLLLDVDKPTVEGIVTVPSDTSAVVTVTAADALSGVASVTLLLNGRAYPPEADGSFLLQNLSSNTAYSFTVIVVDVAGNQFSKEGSVQTGRTDLSGATVLIGGKAAHTAVYTALPICPTDVTVMLADGRIVPADQYEISYENNVLVGSEARLIVTAIVNGDYANTASTTFAIAYAQADEDATLTFGSEGSENWVGGSVTITAPEGYTVSFDGTNVASFVPFVEYAANVDGEIVYYLKNAAGEIAEITEALRLDVNKPTVEGITIIPSDDAATVKVNVNDTLSGVGSVTLLLNGRTYEPEADGSFYVEGLSSNTTYSFTVTVVDKAGNAYTTAPESFTTSQMDLGNPKYTVTVTVNGTYTYNGTLHVPTADAITVVLNGTALEATQFEVVSAENNLHAGTATVVVRGIGNYSGTAEGSFTIEKAALQILAKNQTIIYGDSILNTPDQYVVTGLAATDTLSCVLVREGTSILVTEVAVLSGGVSGLANYQITTIVGSLAVAPSTPVLVPDQSVSLDKIYDGTPVGMPVYEVTGAFTGTVSVQYYKESIAPENLLSAAPQLPGEYLAVVSIAATAENNAVSSAPVAFTVSPRPLAVTVLNQTIGFGGSITSGKDNVSLPEGVLVEGHRIDSVTLHTDDVVVTENGVITLTALTITDDLGRDVTACYEITSTPGRLMIKSGTMGEAQVTVQGSYTYTGSPILPDISSVVVIVKGERLSTDQYTISAVDNVNAGIATLTVTGTGNYIGTTTAAYRIAKAPAVLQQSAVAQSGLTYTGAPQQLLATLPVANTEVEYSGARLGVYTKELSAIMATEPGTYTIYYRAAADANHTVSASSYIVVTIGKAGVLLRDYPNIPSAQYGMPVGALTVSGGRIISHSTPNVHSIPGTWSFANPELTALPGTRYELCFQPEDADAYDSFSTLVTLDVVAAPVSIQLHPDHTQQFPGADITVTASVANGCNASFVDGLPTLIILTWQVGEEGTPTPISDGTFRIPADLPKGTEIIIRAATLAVNGKYEAGSATCKVLVSDKISVEIVGEDQTVTGAGDTFDVSDLFELDPNAGTPTYQIIGGTGAGTLSGTVLTVTESGTFIVEVTTEAVGSYDAGRATATLTVTLDGAAPVIEGVTNGGIYYLTKTVTVTDESLVSLSVNGIPVTSPFKLPGNANASYVIEAVDAAGLITVVTVETRTIESLAEPLAALTVENVKSTDKAAIEGVVHTLAALPISEATRAERDVISALLSKCDALLVRIADVNSDLETLQQRLSKYLLDTVTSAEETDVRRLTEICTALLEGDNLTAEERAQVERHNVKLKLLVERLNQVQSELQRFRDAEGAYRQQLPTYGDINTVKALIADVNTLLAGQNLTAEEREEAQRLAESLSKMLSDISIFGSDISKILEALDGYTLETVTSADRSAIEQLQRDIQSLLTNALLNVEERAAMTTAAEKAEKLLNRITVVAAAISTSAVQGVSKITAENVKKSHEEQLRTAKADLEAAFATFLTNYTEQEKATIVSDIDRIGKAIAALERVADVEAAIEALPDPATVVENDPVAMLAFATAKLKYEALTEHEISLLDAELRDKYANFGRALTNYHVVVGDGSIWVKNCGKDLTFEISCSSNRFVAVYVDGMQVTADFFTVGDKERNTVIVLSADYLQTLSADAHTVLFLFEDGDATAGIIVEAEPSSPWLWLLLIPLLLILIFAAYLIKRYFDRRKAQEVHYND